MTTISFEQKSQDLDNELRLLLDMFNKTKRLKTFQKLCTNANELAEGGFFMNTINHCVQCAFCGTIVPKENVHFAKTLQKQSTRTTRSSRTAAAATTAANDQQHVVCELQSNCPDTCPFRALAVDKDSALTLEQRKHLKKAANHALFTKQYHELSKGLNRLSLF